MCGWNKLLTLTQNFNRILTQFKQGLNCIHCYISVLVVDKLMPQWALRKGNGHFLKVALIKCQG